MSGQQRWVLVVDDDPSIRELVRDVLELSDYQVVTADYGSAGLAALRAARPACVVLDVMMPDMSGLEVLAAIRAEPEWATLPVIMLTAATDDATTWAGWQGGAHCYLAKPFDAAELLRWVGDLTAASPAPGLPPAVPAAVPQPVVPAAAYDALAAMPDPRRDADDIAHLYFELAALAGRFN